MEQPNANNYADASAPAAASADVQAQLALFNQQQHQYLQQLVRLSCGLA